MVNICGFHICNWATMKEFLKIVITSLRRRWLRTSLTMLGIFIGIAAVVALVGLSEGLKEAVNEQFEAMGVDKLIITHKGSLIPGISSGSESLTLKDWRFIKRINEIEDVIYYYMDTAEVEFKNQKLFLPVVSYPTDEKQELFNEAWYFDIEGGRRIQSTDKYKINTGIAFFEDNAFQKNMQLRDKFSINDQDFKIVGYYERVGNSQDDKNIFIEEDTFIELFDTDEDKIDILYAKVRAGEDPAYVADKVERQLREFRGLKEGNEDFSIMTSQEMIEIFGDILNIIEVLLVGVAAISLVVGGIGIMNTMYTAVTERTNEIGIMKAIGARNEDVFTMFFIESGLLGMSGGLIGILIGYGFAKLVESIAIVQLKTTLLAAHFSITLIIGSLMFAFFVGAISGTLPAIQASKLQPVEALRYE